MPRWIEAIQAAQLKGRPVDLLVCNAGVYLDKAEDLDSGYAPEQWAQTFARTNRDVMLGRVLDAIDALAEGNMQRLGQLMFASHDSSRDHFQNSCSQLDAFVDFARQDARCLGARLSGGGFGGISIHLVHMDNAVAYSEDIRQHLSSENDTRVWSVVCQIDNGATMMP